MTRKARRTIEGLVPVLALACSLGAIAQESEKTIRSRPDGPATQSGSAGLFVGCHVFMEDSALNNLRFCANDAIAMAHFFVIERRMIPAANAVLALSGAPDGDAAQQELTELRNAGVRVEPAGRTRVITLVNEVCQRPACASDILIIAFSTHGCEHNSAPYVLLADGLRSNPLDTGLNLSEVVETRMQASQSKKRLLLLDACRTFIADGTKAPALPMSPEYKRAINKTDAHIVLASCDEGEQSLEYPDKRLGVFTYCFLAAARGDAPCDEDDLVRLGPLCVYLRDSVRRAVQLIDPKRKQSPWFKGPMHALNFPVGETAGGAARVTARLKVLGEFHEAGKLSAAELSTAEELLRRPPIGEAQYKLAKVYTRLADRRITIEAAREELALLASVTSQPAPTAPGAQIANRPAGTAPEATGAGQMPAPAPRKYPIVASFESDHEGWRIWNNEPSAKAGASSDVVQPEWCSDSHGRYIGARDGTYGRVWYFDAPDRFLGDLRTARGGRLAFKLASNNPLPYIRAPLVLLTGDRDTVLRYESTQLPGKGWTAFSIKLDETGGWKNHTTGRIATAQEIDAVLSNVVQLRIRGDFGSTDLLADGFLDDVVISALR